uniref:Uncharacterized protein n=1 Tax=Pan paniscus TaxID=9597 RepID=A0A2R8ZNE8_PANPA
ICTMCRLVTYVYMCHVGALHPLTRHLALGISPNAIPPHSPNPTTVPSVQATAETLVELEETEKTYYLNVMWALGPDREQKMDIGRNISEINTNKTSNLISDIAPVAI